MRDLIFAHTATTFTRARLCADHILFQVVKGAAKRGEVLCEICVGYTTMGVIAGILEQQSQADAPVLATDGIGDAQPKKGRVHGHGEA